MDSLIDQTVFRLYVKNKKPWGGGGGEAYKEHVKLHHFNRFYKAKASEA